MSFNITKVSIEMLSSITDCNKIGYLPGQMPWGLSEKLKSLGATIMNTKADKTVCLDRKLLTGASPLSANNLGKLAAETLLENLK